MNMKMKKIKKILTTAAVIAILSGCSNPADKQQNSFQENAAPRIENGGYVSGMLNAKNQAEKEIERAVENENKKIIEAGGETAENLLKQYSGAVLKTNFGDIKVKLYVSESPKTAGNFLQLADRKFYDGTKFHRVIRDFMIQGGDPNSKDDNWADDGQGDPGYKFADEFNSRKLTRGSLAMANSGPNTNGSQFFIVTAASTPWLDGKHTNFGEVVEGMDVVDKIEKAKTDKNNHPMEDVVIKSVELVR